MFGKKDDSSSDFSKRSTRSLYKSKAGSQPGSIVHTQACSEIEYRNQRTANMWKTVAAVLTVIGIMVAVATYIKG